MRKNLQLAALTLVAVFGAPYAVLAQSTPTAPPGATKPEAPPGAAKPEAPPGAAKQEAPPAKPEAGKLEANPAPEPTKTAGKSKSKKTPSAIEISNKRANKLMEFEISQADTGKSVGKLSKPLASNVKIRMPLKGAKGCEFIARWRFEDAGDEGQIDLCNDPRIVLTD